MALDRAKLLAARYKAAEARPYLASALYALTVVPSDGVRTMGVDRHWRCYVSPGFVDATPVAELAGVWVHEVAHLLRDHHGRADRLPAADQRDHVRVNIAQDCEINDDLLADGLALPRGRMEPGLFGLPTGGLFETYLPAIPATCHGSDGVDCGSGAHGTAAPWELGGDGGPARVGPVEAEALRRQTAQAVRAHQRGRGRIPAGWARWAEELLEPTVDWRRALAGAVREAAAWAAGAVDYTYRRPSRRTPRSAAGWCCPACAGRCRGSRSSSTPPGRWATTNSRPPSPKSPVYCGRWGSAATGSPSSPATRTSTPSPG